MLTLQDNLLIIIDCYYVGKDLFRVHTWVLREWQNGESTFREWHLAPLYVRA